MELLYRKKYDLKTDQLLGGDLSSNNSLDNWLKAEKALAVKVHNDKIVDAKTDILNNSYLRIYTIKSVSLSDFMVQLWQVTVKDKKINIKFDYETGTPINLGVPKHLSPDWGNWVITPYIYD